MQRIITRISFDLDSGAKDILDTTDLDDLLNDLSLQQSKTDAIGKPLNIGTEFSIDGSAWQKGRFKVKDIKTCVQTEVTGEASAEDFYTWNMHIVYLLEAVA